MAPAHFASECMRADSIKGLAQSIAKPAYRRLLTAEPTLRRAVPVLIIAFLVTIAVGAVLQVLDQRRHAIAGAAQDIDAVAYLVRAVTPGAFVHPAATAEDMYRPDRFARTAAGRLTVR